MRSIARVIVLFDLYLRFLYRMNEGYAVTFFWKLRPHTRLTKGYKPRSNLAPNQVAFIGYV